MPTRMHGRFLLNPVLSLVVYCGNDGGFFSCASGTTFTSLNAGGIQTALFYNLDVKRDATASVTLGALQDNGIVSTAGEPVPTWKMGAGGDGFAVAHDWVNATSVYGRFNATIVGSTDDGDSYSNITPPWPASEGGPTSRPSRPIQTRAAACMRAAS